ncbi:MAG: LytTR family transcriptional regulator [Alistipes sp.]|nr:LytTR family transcriptional regulator [Alistipes sp.]
MLQLPRIFQTKSAQLIHVVSMPLTFFAFMVIYRPFHIEEHLSIGQFPFGVHLTLLSCIIFGTTALLRTIYYLIRRRVDKLSYFFWAIFEMVVAAFFVALYAWLIDRCAEPYFLVLSRALAWVLPVLIYPYVIITLALFLVEQYRHNRIEEKQESKIRFYDERKNLKLVVEASSILYIAAEENYINISYLDGQSLNSYLLRRSMKSVESLCAEYGLLRCHRSYYINPAHIKALRKERDGAIVAEIEGVEREIPVTKRYYDTISEHI